MSIVPPPVPPVHDWDSGDADDRRLPEATRIWKKFLQIYPELAGPDDRLTSGKPPPALPEELLQKLCGELCRRHPALVGALLFALTHGIWEIVREIVRADMLEERRHG